MDLEGDGTCVRFSPLMTAAGKAVTTLSVWLGQKESTVPTGDQQSDDWVSLVPCSPGVCSISL